MSDFAKMLELATKYRGQLTDLVALAEKIEPEVLEASSAVKAIVDALTAHKAAAAE